MGRILIVWGLALGLAAGLMACSKSTEHAQHMLSTRHAPEIARLLEGDARVHLEGIVQVAERVVPGYVSTDSVQRAALVQQRLTRIRKPPSGVPQLFASPLTFVAALDAEGVVIARNGKKTRMVGMNLAKGQPLIQEALKTGAAGHGILEYSGEDDDAKKTVIWTFVAPVKDHDKILGAVVLGIPLWRLDQRINNQLRIDYNGGGKNKGLILWAYLFHGDTLHEFGTPPDLGQLVPKPAVRRAGLKRSPKGYTGEVAQYGRKYAFGVFKLSAISPELGLILFRSDPD